MNKLTIHIDIGHPAHVHYFKYFISLIKGLGHDVVITARDKEITFELLDYYNLTYIPRGKGGNNLLTKILYILFADIKLFTVIKKNNCDISLSFASTYAAHAAKMAGIPHIAFDDTEHAKLELMLYPPFTDIIFTPYCFTRRISENQYYYNSFTELLYLHKTYYKPDFSILKDLDLKENEDYVIVRFVSWSASHDIGQKGLTKKDKIDLVKNLSKNFRVFVSSEGVMPKEIQQFNLKIHPAKIHDALYFARIYIGEGGTTASESALLGTPAIFVNRLSMGYIEEEKKAGLLFQLTNLNEIYEKVVEISSKEKQHYKEIANHFISNKIDPTKLLEWFVANYPTSINRIKENPNIINNI